MNKMCTFETIEIFVHWREKYRVKSHFVVQWDHHFTVRTDTIVFVVLTDS